MTVAVGVEYEEVTPSSPVNGPLFRTLFERYLDELAPYVASEFRAERDPQGVWLDRYFAESITPAKAWLFRFRGAAAGFTIVHAWPEGLQISEFYVVPGHRRMGVGSATVQHLQGYVRNGTFPGLVAMIYDANAPALAFWQKHAFEFVRPVESPPYPPGLGLYAWPPGAYRARADQEEAADAAGQADLPRS